MDGKALEEKCSRCILKNEKGICTFYTDCLRELRTGMVA